MSAFVNRIQELKILNENTSAGTRVNIIYSLKGRGKSCLISHCFEHYNDVYFINVSNEELYGKMYAEDYYYLKKITKCLSDKLPLNFGKKIKTRLNETSTDISFSVNAFFAGLGFSIPKCYRLLQSSIIKYIKNISCSVYIHIENMQKIDIPSLKFLARLVNETNNVYLYLEYTIENDKTILVDSSSVYKKFNITPVYIEIKSLDWSHICSIFSELHLIINNSLKQEYLELDGDIKTLIFNTQHSEKITLSQDECFLLSFIELTNAELDCQEIYEAIRDYNATSLVYAFRKINIIINILIEKGVASEINGNLFITREGLKYTDKKYRLLATEILAAYYMPLIESNSIPLSKTILKGLKILVSVFTKSNDNRLKRIVPVIKKYLLPLNYNKKIIDDLFNCIKNITENQQLFFCLIQIYISLGCYKEVLLKLEGNFINCFEYKILCSSALVHIYPEKSSTEKTIKIFINNETNLAFKSAFYTCLVALYMKIKSSKFVLEFIEDIYDKQLITKSDQKIINKNISIYYDYTDAIEKIKDSIKFFHSQNMLKFETASLITLSTRYFQNGKISDAKKILQRLSEKSYLSEEDLLYIENNLANIDIYLGTISEKTYDGLITAYYSLEDEYTKMLAVNNLLIYHTFVRDYSSAKKYVDEIEKVGFKKYLFDEFLHLTYTNLVFYYNSINDNINTNIYIKKLETLKSICQSLELKKYIDNTISNQCLSQNDKWYFMSQYNFRAAFMGHWIINSYDV